MPNGLDIAGRRVDRSPPRQRAVAVERGQYVAAHGALRGGAWQLAGFLLLWALAFAFVFFTYRPIHLPLWQDPTNGLYGLAAARAAG